MACWSYIYRSATAAEMDWVHSAAALAAAAAAATDDVLLATLDAQLRDLLFRFPCSVLEGVRWSCLGRAHRERFGSQGLPSFGSRGAAALRVTLADCAEFQTVTGGGAGEGLVRLLDSAALSPPPAETPPMACWPLLAKGLGDIVQFHGWAHNAGELSGQAGFAGCTEVLVVLLSQLKPLLRKHWDPSFEERGVGYYADNGNYVNVKKMKHLITSVLKWRSDRLNFGLSSSVDLALGLPLALVASAQHNDMLLCCPRWAGYSYAFAPWPMLDPGSEDKAMRIPPGFEPEARSLAAAATAAANAAGNDLSEEAPEMLDASHLFSELDAQVDTCPHEDCLAQPSATLPGSGTPLALIAEADGADVETVDIRPSDADTGAAASPVIRPQTPASPAKAPDAHLREIQGLRIENAELKKRVRFGSDFLHKEIRRLRIENAELKKRLNVGHGRVQVWVPMLAPFAAAPTAVAGGPSMPGVASPEARERPDTPTVGGPPSPLMADLGQPSSGNMTPIPQGFCYMPMSSAGSVVSPVGQPWPMLAMQFGPGGIGPIMSPHSDASHQMGLLPRSLLSGSEGPSLSHSVASPGGHGSPWREPRTAPKVDDRWYSIPSGIVERQVAQIQSRGSGQPVVPASSILLGDAAAAAANATAISGGALGGGTEVDTPTRPEGRLETRSPTVAWADAVEDDEEFAASRSRPRSRTQSM